MPRRLLLALFVAMVACGLCFYVLNFAGLIYAAATGPLNPTNAHGLQMDLRRFALPFSAAVGVVVFCVVFARKENKP
jgi:TRAP-type C4-dicarboxylate transport system permease small subunit